MSEDDGPYDVRGKRRDGRPGGPPSKEQMEKVRKRVEMVRIWKLTEALDLDEKTADRLFPILRKYDKQKVELRSEMFRSRRQIRQMESGRGGEKVDAKKLLEDMEKSKARMTAIEEEQYKEIKKVLTPEQMVKYIAFEERFRREMKQMMRESREGGDGGKGRPGMRNRSSEDYGGGDGRRPSGMDDDGAPPRRSRR
ncbi:Spy/CpxP family protein refolding chaperone [Nitrospirota bacterium]